MIRSSLSDRINWDKIAVIEGQSFFSFRSLAQKADAVRRLLPQKQNENVAIFLPNSIGYIAALYGIFMSGAAAFPLSIQLTVYEIVPLLKQVSARVVITSDAYRTFFAEVSSLIDIQVIFIEEVPEAERLAGTLTDKTEQVLPLSTDNIDADKPLVLLATSGTTGKAKIVQLSERNISSSVYDYINKMDFAKYSEGEIRFTLGTPYSSVYGLMVIAACVVKSITIVVLKNSFTLDTLFKLAEKHRVTHFEGGVSVGLMLEQMAGRPVSHDVSSLKYYGLAGSKLSADALRRLMKAYSDVEFWTGYGMTEAGPLIAKPDKKVNTAKLDSVGTRGDNVTIMVESNGFLTDAPDTKGEIVVKGPNVMLGYYNNDEETQKILKDGWLYTGDIGYLDGDGYLYICGRKKNIIIVRGFNVHAEEVESCLLNSGLVQDCVVYGETDSAGGETVCADIIPLTPQIDIEEIRAYCKERLASYKQPQQINIIEAIKKTATGKTERG